MSRTTRSHGSARCRRSWRRHACATRTSPVERFSVADKCRVAPRTSIGKFLSRFAEDPHHALGLCSARGRRRGFDPPQLRRWTGHGPAFSAWLALTAALRFPLELVPGLFCLRSQTGKPLRRQVANELRRREGRIAVRFPEGCAARRAPRRDRDRTSATETRRRRSPRYRNRREDIRRKVGEVVGDDMLRAAADCRRQDVAVVGIGKFERPDQRLVSGDQRLRKMLAHACRWERTLRSRCGFRSRRFTVHSSRIPFGPSRPGTVWAWWKRRRMSRLRNGYRTLASRRATRRSASCIKTHRTLGRVGRGRRAPHGARRRDGPCRPSDRRA